MSDQAQSTARPTPKTPEDVIELTVCEAQAGLVELVSLLTYAQRRLDATATRLPVNGDRARMESFEVPFDVPTEMVVTLTECSNALGELVDRLRAASVVTATGLRQEFPELRAAARAPRRRIAVCRSPDRSTGRRRLRQTRTN